MPFLHVFSSIPVANRDTAVEWYQRFSGRPPDLIPNDIEAAWRLTDSGWIYVIVDLARAGTALNTLLVDDLDAVVAGLQDRGVVVGPVETMGNGARFVMLTDPDGNQIKVAQVQ